MPPESRAEYAAQARRSTCRRLQPGDAARGRRRLRPCQGPCRRARRRHAGLCRPLRPRRVRGGARAGRAAAHRAARVLRRHGGARRRARGARAAGESRSMFVWPDTIEVDGGVVGGGQFAWPDGPEDEPPPWLVFGGMIRTVSMADGDPGCGRSPPRSRMKASTMPAPAGWSRASRATSWCRSTPGRSTASRRWRRTICRGSRPRRACSRDIDDNGDLLVRRMGKVEVERRKLLPALADAGVARSEDRGPR